MNKVSIGLRGWRFEESAVFTDDGSFLPLDEMPADTRRRVNRLTALVNRPCGACWLEHGDEEVERCNTARVVYGEPMAEVVLCDDHESDFVYWFNEAGGSRYRGGDDLDDAFYEWFLENGRAPDGYAGVTHVDSDPESLPDPEAALDATRDDAESEESGKDTNDEGYIREGSDSDAESELDDNDGDGSDDPELDLSREYPRSR